MNATDLLNSLLVNKFHAAKRQARRARRAIKQLAHARGHNLPSETVKGLNRKWVAHLRERERIFADLGYYTVLLNTRIDEQRAVAEYQR